MSVLVTEINSIPACLGAAAEQSTEAIAQAARDWQQAAPAMLMTVARGTSDAAATFAAHEFTRLTQTPVGSFTPSLASLEGFTHTSDLVRVLAISQSGQSPDLVAALAAFAPATRWALTNVTPAPLTEIANHNIPIGAGTETSVAATKSLACSLLQIHLLALACAKHEPPDVAAVAAAADAGLNNPLELEIFTQATSAFVLGRGPTLSIAQEAAIKLKELTGLHAEALSAAEVMHGPKALAGSKLPVLAFSTPGNAGDSVVQAAKVFTELGSPVVLAQAADANELAAVLRVLCAFYAAVPQLATARGYDPDAPVAITKVTETK